MTRSSKRSLLHCAVAAALVGVTATVARAQEVAVESPAAAQLRVTTVSEEAARHFWAGLTDARNVFPARATMHFDRALAIDRDLGLARVVRAATAPGLTQDERKTEVERGLASLTSGATGEILTALAFREAVAGNAQQAQALFGAAAKILPGDPHVAHFAAQWTANVGEPAGGIAAFRAVTAEFPDNAPSYNSLAYLLWQTGDHEGAFTAVKRYVELAPDHPNAHDSYAELLQWDSRFTEALAHYRRAIDLDSSYTEAYLGIAEVLQLTGRGDEARRHIQLAIARAPSTPARLNYSRALAHSLLLDGRLKEGMDQLAAVAREAEADNRRSIAAEAYRMMANADAILGRGSAIATHLAAAAKVSDADAPVTLAVVAVAQGTAGDVPTAREAARQLAEKAGTATWVANLSHTARAVILLRENKGREALAELGQVNGDDPLVRALRAEGHRATGNMAEARALRSRVISDPNYSLTSAYETLARLRATKVKV